jgi:hypothetical protein
MRIFSSFLDRRAAQRGGDQAATRMSGSEPQRACPAMIRCSFQGLAHRSLCLLAAVMSPACLVTSTSEFQEPQQTPPFLVASTADPDIREFLIVVDGETRKDFSASIISEDRGHPVKVALYIDYGEPNVAGQPFRYSLTNFPDIAPGSLSDDSRRVQAQWFPEIQFVENGCHTVTMVVTHEFDFLDCPKVPTDSSQLVWKVLRCKSRETCDPISINDPALMCPSSEQSPLASCLQNSTGPDAGDGGGP